MERKRGLLLVRHAVVLQNLVRSYMCKSVFEKKRNLRRNLQSVLKLQSMLRRSIAQHKYAAMIGVVIQVKKRMSIQEGESNKQEEAPIEPMPSISENLEADQVVRCKYSCDSCTLYFTFIDELGFQHMPISALDRWGALAG